MPFDYTECGAIISLDELYRYQLTREWGPSTRTMIYCMLNPSTADSYLDDPTIKRCVGFAAREGCGRLTVINLGAFRTKSPRLWKKAEDPFGPENMKNWTQVLVGAIAAGHPIVAAWGVHGSFNGYDKRFQKLAQDLGAELLCFGQSLGGQPLHPLMLRSDTPLVPYRMAHV